MPTKHNRFKKRQSSGLKQVKAEHIASDEIFETPIENLTDLLSPSLEFLDAFNKHITHGSLVNKSPKNRYSLETFMQCYVKNCSTAFSTLRVRVLSSHATTECNPAETQALLSIQRFIIVTDTDKNVEIPIFSMVVVEYPQNCGSTRNAGRVYIMYIDVTNLKTFTPNNPYFDIMASYLSYMTRIGYKFAHIWSCPPDLYENGELKPFSTTTDSERMEVYLFRKENCKRLNQAQLDGWYEKMLKHGGWYFNRLTPEQLPPLGIESVIPTFLSHAEKKTNIMSDCTSMSGHVFVVHLRTKLRLSKLWELIESGPSVHEIIKRCKELDFTTTDNGRISLATLLREFNHSYRPQDPFVLSINFTYESIVQRTNERTEESNFLEESISDPSKPYPVFYHIAK